MDLTFDLCVSLDRYEHKPTKKECAKMRFERRTVSIDDMIALVSNGHAYCSVMKDNHHSDANFISSRTLTFDIDHSSIPLQAYIAKVEHKPTFAYTSSSNGIKDYCFRMVYVLDSDITSKEEYENLSKGFAKQLNLDFVDKKSYSCSQLWFGCCNCELHKSENVISKDVIAKINPFLNKKREHSNDEVQNGHKLYIIQQHHYVVSVQFQRDYENMMFQDFIAKYMTTYPNIAKTPLELDEDTAIIKYPENYYEIRRPWKRINGEVMKIKDGENRRRKLFLNGIIRKKINPSITFENLLFNLVFEFEFYYINDGNTITKKDIWNIATNVMRSDTSTYNDLGKPRYKSFVNPHYCQKHNMTKQQVWANARNKQQYIGEFYDPSLTDNENVKVMREYGLDITAKTLQRWRKTQGIKKYKK